MKNQRYYNSLNVLISAFMKGNLKHGNTCNCAIGNMIQATGISKIVLSDAESWYDALTNNKQTKESKRLPYTLQEQIKIEASFEGGIQPNIKDNKTYFGRCSTRTLRAKIDKDGFIGLTEVQETLYHMEDWSHENVDLIKLGKENKKLELV